LLADASDRPKAPWLRHGSGGVAEPEEGRQLCLFTGLTVKQEVEPFPEQLEVQPGDQAGEGATGLKGRTGETKAAEAPIFTASLK